MSMVEQVARALAANRYMSIGGADSTALGKPAWVYCVPDALTAIEAMREPTEKMERAARFWSPSLRESYSEMIDAALNEQDQG